jgi:glycolate oxidase iron-sulfur subunit
MVNTPAPERFLDYDKSLACIHCGLCLSSCPTYLETGNENDSPRGRVYLMRAVQDGRLPVEGAAVTHLDRCLGCRACEAVCPSGVQYGNLLEHTRDHIEKHHKRGLFQTFLRRVAIEKVFPFPSRMKVALAPAKAAKRLGLENILPKFAREALSLIPERATSLDLPEVSPTTTKKRGRVGFISGCVMSVMFGETNSASVQLLTAGGFDVITPKDQGCCGALYAHSGQLERARESARKNIEAFEKEDLDAIIINAAGCGSTLKEYDQLLHDDPEWRDRAKAFSAKTKDLTEFLVSSGFVSTLRASTGALKVTYHDACHLAHAQRVTKQPRDLVKAVAGKNYIELPEADVCCGSAGTYNLTQPELAERLQNRKIENILKTGADIVVTSNPGCLLQIQAGLKKAGSKIRALHVADFLTRDH